MSEESAVNYNIDEFKSSVLEWVRIDEDLSNIQKVIREKRKRRQNLSEFIATYMQHTNKEICNIGDNNAIVLSKRKATCSLKKEHIVTVLNDLLRNEEQSKELMEKMYGMREVREKSVIKKTEIN
jgi:Glu-tRNA(Gln) amidotransferase subunit E-like FAD-binding protein